MLVAGPGRPDVGRHNFVTLAAASKELLDGAFQDVEIQAQQPEDAPQGNRILQYRLTAKGLQEVPDRQGIELHPGLQVVLHHLEPLVIENAAPGHDFARMSIECILIEPDQQVEIITVRHHFLFANTQAEPHMSPPHEGLIAVVGENMQPQARTDLRQVVTGGPRPIAGGPPNTNCHFKLLHIAHPPFTPEETFHPHYTPRRLARKGDGQNMAWEHTERWTGPIA